MRARPRRTRQWLTIGVCSALSETNRIEEIRKLGQDGESRQMDRQTHEAGNLARKIIVANFTENIRSVVD